MQLNNLLWIPILVLGCYAPILCWLDIKYRDIFSHMIWLPAAIINIPLAIILVNGGIYTWWMGLLEIIAVLFWFLMMVLKIINGADYMYLTLISTFVVINPITNHLMLLPFMIFLIVWMALSMWYIFLKNKRDGIKPALYIEGGLPMMIPISLALFSAVVFG